MVGAVIAHKIAGPTCPAARRFLQPSSAKTMRADLSTIESTNTNRHCRSTANLYITRGTDRFHATFGEVFMSLGECPHLDCNFNIDGACHHALRPDPGDCEYHQPAKKTLQYVSQNSAQFHHQTPQPFGP